MKPKSLIPILVLISATLAVEIQNESTEIRKRKMFSLFSVVTFPNNQCTGATSTSSTPVLGTCFSSTECTSKGGTADGNCAAGFGVCCTFLVSACSSDIRQNCTYIQNPSYPTSYSTAGSCEYNVHPLSSDICQLRLDFDNMDITDDNDGTCTDSFTVTSGSSRDYFEFCGTFTGQHMYMETGRTTNSQKLTFTIGTTSTVGTWRIKVNQIECFSPWKAPSDCLQYFKELTDEVKSFNYPNALQSDLLYTICVRQEAGFCGIEWNAVDSTSPDTFHLSVIASPTAGLALGATVTPGAYIHIPGSINGEYGGGVLSDDGTTTTANQDTTGGTVRAVGQLFHVQVNSHTTDADTTGFHLVYNQVPCDTSSL